MYLNLMLFGILTCPSKNVVEWQQKRENENSHVDSGWSQAMGRERGHRLIFPLFFCACLNISVMLKVGKSYFMKVQDAVCYTI